MFGKKLAGRKIAIVATDGFEQVELTIPMKALCAEGAIVDVISLHGGKIRGMNFHRPGKKVAVDRTLSEARSTDYDGLLIPGGLINPDILRQSREAREFVREFDLMRKPIATLCHGPWLLVSAGLMKGRQITSWPGIRDDMVNAGGVWRDEKLVRDGNWVSSRSPSDMVAFVSGMIDLFAEHAPATAPSSPQPEAPPTWALRGFESKRSRSPWRKVLGAAAIAAGAVAGVALVKRAA